MQPPVVTLGDELSNVKIERAEKDRMVAVVQRKIDAANESAERSVFAAPYRYIEAMQSSYRSHHPECILTGHQHDCTLDANCTHTPLPIRIYRRMGLPRPVEGCAICNPQAAGRQEKRECIHREPPALEHHICLRRECVHLAPGHVCRLARCWHSPGAVFPEKDVHDVPDVYVCSRSGSLHVCGARCAHKNPVITPAGVIVCSLTGMVVGKELLFDFEQSNIFGADPGGHHAALDSIDYETGDPSSIDYQSEGIEFGQDAAAALTSTGLTPRAAAMSLLEGPAPPSRWTPSLSPRELEDLRARRRKVLLAEIEPFVASRSAEARGVLDAALKPVRDAIKAGSTKRWPGVMKMMCRLAEAEPRPFHPSWRGWRIDRLAVPSAHERRIWELMGLDRPREAAKTDAIAADEDPVEAALALFERLEQIGAVQCAKFETAVPGLLKILDAGVLTEQGVAVRQRPMEWYVSRRSSALCVQWTEATKKAYIEGRFGSCV